MLALIDSDIFQHEFGNATNDEGVPLSWPLVQSRVQGRVNGIMEATGADKYQLFITSDDKSNFRYNIATIKPYKGNRKGLEKPRYYYQIRNFLIDHRNAIEVFGMEADDAMSIWQYKDTKNTIICSRDKDLHMVPGWHYSWGAGKQKEQQLWWQDEINGYRKFYKQCLTGDSVDNIPGLFGVGKSSTTLRAIDAASTSFEMYSIVLSEYTKRFGNYAEQFLLENARLLWMLREEGEVWCPPTSDGRESSSQEENNSCKEEG